MLNLEKSSEMRTYASAFCPKGTPTGKPSPFYVQQGNGARIQDIDGNTYMDYWCGAGPVILGHANSAVNAAVIKAIEAGTVQFYIPSSLQVAVMAKLSEHIPCAEKGILATAGSDALACVARIARSYTGKPRLAKFEGGYQGWHDELSVSNAPDLSKAGNKEQPNTVPDSAGANIDKNSQTLVLPYNDLATTEKILTKEKDAIACVIVEPMIHGNNLMPKEGFLEGLRELCSNLGILLVFDEIVTGFRHGLQGGQGVVNVIPDMGVFGKAMANGFIISAVCGKKELLSLVAPEGKVRTAGTFAGSALSCSAALATIEVLETPGFYEHLFKLGNTLRDEVNKTAQQLGVKARCDGYGSVWCMYFSDETPQDYRDIANYRANGGIEKDQAYRSHMLNNGIFLRPQLVNRAYINAAHSENDIQTTIDVITSFMKENKQLINN